MGPHRDPVTTRVLIGDDGRQTWIGEDLKAEPGGAVGTAQGPTQAPVPWHLMLRGLNKSGATKPKRPVIFECVGVPGIIEQIITAAPILGTCLNGFIVPEDATTTILDAAESDIGKR